MRPFFFTLALLGASLLTAQNVPGSRPGSLTLDQVVQETKQKQSEDILIDQIRKNATPFDLNQDEISDLKKEGVSDTVIKYLIDPTLPPPAPPAPPPPPPAQTAAPAAPPPPPPAPKRTPSDPLAPKVPMDNGVYLLGSSDQFAPLALATVMPYKQPGKITALSAGLVKGHVVGSIAGAAAKTRVSGSSYVFYLRLPEKTMIEDFTLVEVEKEKDHRNLDFGTKPGKTAFAVSAVKQFDSKEADTGIYRLTVPMLKKGEYIFFIRGTEDDKKGLMGKGYDFGVN